MCDKFIGDKRMKMFYTYVKYFFSTYIFNSFDNVISLIALQFSIDIKKALSEMIRVAKNKIGIGFLNKNSLANYFNTKERRRLYKEAVTLTDKQIKNFLKEILGKEIKRTEINTRYTLYLPGKLGYFFPMVDDIFEKINLPFGDYAVMIIKKDQLISGEK